MAVIIQEVVGRRHGERFYPDISGVGRSYSFYSFLRLARRTASLTWRLAGQDDRRRRHVVDILSGLSAGSRRRSRRSRPARGTQTKFWAVNMGKPPAYDPVSETEYLVSADLPDAEADETLRFVASTFDPSRDRVVPGTGSRGPRILDFAPMLILELAPLNPVIQALLTLPSASVKAKVEIEFAITIDQRGSGHRLRLGFLQVRPMVVSTEWRRHGEELRIRGYRCVGHGDGNGIEDGIHDIVYVRPEKFSPMRTAEIAEE